MYGQVTDRTSSTGANANAANGMNVDNNEAAVGDPQRIVSVPMPETDDWCSITYHELACRVGESFHGKF